MDTNQGNRIDLPVKGNLSLLHAASLQIAVLMAGVSIAGLPERVIIYPTKELVQTFVPNDVVNLLIGLPVLLGSMWLAWRGKRTGPLLWMGALFFVFYNYTAYVFAMPLNGAFMACLFLMMLSAYTLIALVAMIDGKAVQKKLTGAVHEKFAGGVLAGLGILFIFRGTAVLMNAINTGGTLAQTELAVNLADFLIAPAWIIGGILLWRRRELGYVTGLGLLFQGSMLFIALIDCLFVTTATPDRCAPRGRRRDCDIFDGADLLHSVRALSPRCPGEYADTSEISLENVCQIEIGMISDMRKVFCTPSFAHTEATRKGLRS